MRCLGFDIGSSSIKGTILDLEQGQVGKTVRSEFPAPIDALQPGHFEVRLSEIEAVFEALLAEAMALAPDARHLFCSGQMGGLVLVDRTGRPLTHYLSWRDQRTRSAGASGESYLAEMAERWSVEVLQELGNELKPGSTASLLYWLAENQQLPEGGQPVTIADYLLGRLCNTAAPMDPTHALGLLNLHDRTWHRLALETLGLGQLSLPQLATSREPLGQATVGGRSITCFPSYGDQPCALRGVELQCDELSLNISTGSQVSCRTTSFEPGNYQTRMYFGGDFLNTVTHLPAGRSLSVLFELLTELAKAEEIELRHAWDNVASLAANAPTSDLEADLAFFSGPMGDTGSIRNITTENLSVGSLFRAAFVNMTDNFIECARRLRPDGPWHQLVLSGGLAQSMPVLKQMIQQGLDLPIRESIGGEETLEGLLKIALAIID